MKEVAYVGLIFGIIGLLLMIYGAFGESNYRSIDCEDGNYVFQNYGGSTSSPEYEKCYDDKAKVYDVADLSFSIGNANMLFSLVLIIGANRL